MKSFVKDGPPRLSMICYFVYAFAVGMKLMTLVIIAHIGSEVLRGLSSRHDPV